LVAIASSFNKATIQSSNPVNRLLLQSQGNRSPQNLHKIQSIYFFQIFKEQLQPIGFQLLAISQKHKPDCWKQRSPFVIAEHSTSR
jgi:hypothetical protein